MNDKQIMAIYDAEICKGGSADSVIQRTVLAAIAAHDAKREKIYLLKRRCDGEYEKVKAHHVKEVVEYGGDVFVAYIEREGA